MGIEIIHPMRLAYDITVTEISKQAMWQYGNVSVVWCIKTKHVRWML